MVPSSAVPPGDPLPSTHPCILVVEDELLIRVLLSEELRDVGYHVIEAFNADEAVELLRSVAPSLIISDVRMPGSIDGLGLLAIIRQATPSLPVIITSAHLEPCDALADGATQFVSKPFAVEIMVKAVQEELAKRHD
jgi:CheY-like chemotaxis protein